MSFFLPSLVVAAGVLSGLSPVSAQIRSDVQCSAAYNWAYNSRNQSPCLVAAYLGGACNGGAFAVNSLTPLDYYIGPTSQSANPCLCSSIVYSLLSACAGCQDRSFVGWRDWNANCPSPYLRLFPVDIPSGTSVPAWAYLDVGASDTYSPTLARAAASSPESSASSRGTATRPGSTGTSTSKSKDSGTNVAAIAGGVVGGIAFLGIIAGIAAFIILRRRRAAQTAPSAAYSNAYNGDGYPVPPNKEYGYGPGPFTPSSEMATTPGGVPRLYDPTDPSTYPTAPVSPTLHTTDSLPYHDSSYGAHGGHLAPPPPRGAYSGAPEI